MLFPLNQVSSREAFLQATQLGNLGIRGSFLPVLQEFCEHDHVLGLQMHVESIYSLFANSE
jgi:hypothetical protein